MRKLLAAAPLLLIAGCVAAPEGPPPPPPPQYVPPPPPPAPAPAPVSSDWRDWPLTPGDWRYSPDSRGSVARYGTGVGPAELELRCDRASRQVTMVRRANPAASRDLTIRTSSTVRALPGRPEADGGVSVTVPANDPILDAMGFSRGRFVVQQPGGQNLVVPAWAEILRVAEDCRG